MYERILVAIDGGPSSALAIGQATTLAKACNAEVKVLFVVDDSDLFFESSYINPDDVMRELSNAGNTALAAAALRLENAGVRFLTELAERPVSPGQISATIVERAERWPADLIVMGTHGRRGFRRMVMGSVSEGVVAKTNKPVLLIRGEPSPTAG
ncbi:MULTISPECIES: universal stress protein [unclassified Cupriavidus]|uniref:universal stress protein n=1 Tax=Cupriavidus sp. H19C3 TaxID=3241603 RepID=UPI003BF8C120